MRMLISFACLLFCSLSLAQSGSENVKYIDPRIGNVGHLLEPTRPLVHLPNQMVRFTPDRKDYLDLQISSFPLTIVSHRMGYVFGVTPSYRAYDPGNPPARMMFDHDLEVIHPWYYSTHLVEDGMQVEFTPGRHTGFFRFSFSEAGSRYLLFHHYNNGPSEWKQLSATEIAGQETFDGGVRVYFYGVFGQPAKGRIDGRRASFGFDDAAGPVELRYAISFVGYEQARKNFDAEIRGASFDKVQSAARAEWERVMSQVRVEGGTEAQKRSFYTSLYRYYERMVNISEDSLYYSGFNKKVNSGTRPFYVDDWSWDTYLAQHPLRTILDPSMQEDMLQSYVTMYEQSGWMPTFPVIFGDHACMNGFHSSVMFLDAHRKGLKNFNIEKAYEGMRKNAVSATMIPWRNGEKTVLDDHYHRNGYFPALRPGEKETVSRVHSFEKRQSVAVTLGHSYDDWALAELARELGKKDDHQKFAARAFNYKNLWEKDQRLFMPKDAQGKWIAIDPKFDGGMGGRDYYDENNGWTYQWQVQHDIPGLIALMGGKSSFEKRLDQLFTEGLDRSKFEFWSKFPDATGLVGQFSMGNEPSFHIPYLYNFTDAPWKTQQRIRLLLDVWFRDNVFGIPGDEDGGGMTSFVVFSSMGFYPVTPGLALYTIGSPVFEKTAISLPNGNVFRIDARNASAINKYIQSAKFNGKKLDAPWFTHDQLMSGGLLELEMGPMPNKTWGRAPASVAQY